MQNIEFRQAIFRYCGSFFCEGPLSRTSKKIMNLVPPFFFSNPFKVTCSNEEQKLSAEVVIVACGHFSAGKVAVICDDFTSECCNDRLHFYSIFKFQDA